MSVVKRAARVVGAILSLVCVGWVGWRFYSSGLLQRIETSGHAGLLAERIGQAVPVYALGVIGLGVAWWTLQCVFAAEVPVRATVTTYAVTQLGKYLPGGVAQYVGRHIMLRRMGLAHAALALCAMGEALLLLGAALEWGAPLLLRDSPRWMTVTIAIVIPCILFVLAVALARLGRRDGWLAKRMPVFNSRWLAATFVIHLCFFAIMAVTLAIVATATVRDIAFPILAASAAISWMAGYIVLGAPAGIGVREVVFISMLGGIAPQQDILVLVAGFRAATFGGDVLAFVLGLLLSPRVELTN